MQVDDQVKEALKTTILQWLRAHPGATREQLLGEFFEFYETCLSELTDSGFLAVSKVRDEDSHLDVLMPSAGGLSARS